MKEVFVEVKNFGSCFGVNSKRRHNCVHLAYLSFFNIVATPCLKTQATRLRQLMASSILKTLTVRKPQVCPLTNSIE